MLSKYKKHAKDKLYNRCGRYIPKRRIWLKVDMLSRHDRSGKFQGYLVHVTSKKGNYERLYFKMGYRYASVVADLAAMDYIIFN